LEEGGVTKVGEAQTKGITSKIRGIASSFRKEKVLETSAV
jgi:hypothetical protein